jgi:hypothetical protein
VSAIVLDQDAQGRPVDPIQIAHRLEQRVRHALEAPGLAAPVSTCASSVLRR